MGQVRNILFIMCDQLRADYLGCNGHPTLRTPHIDALAQRGVNFSRAYCQAPVCGPSRMSFYTGRYMYSHGSTYNSVPLRIGELTLGDHLRPLGVRTGLIGKTHMKADIEGMARLGLRPDASQEVILVRECGFEPWERDDGLHPDQAVSPDLAYNHYLRSLGYEGDNPWHTHANSAEGPNGEILSGWLMRNAHLPARVKKEHSETAYMTDRAMETIRRLGDAPWCMHLSYIKPHWPYMAPAPYHHLYSQDDIAPPVRSSGEREAPHPVIAAFMQHEESTNFSNDEIRQRVIPTYMGLITEIDDHIGRLMDFLEREGRLEDTLIVFTSDHGDYLGDHWLGEKEMFHEQSVRIPLIVCDPDPAADATRGTVDERFVESIDLVPTFLDACGGEDAVHVLEGRSLLPLLRGAGVEGWRDAVFSEVDYAFRRARHLLNLKPDETRAFMIRTDRWKYISYNGFRPQLFDMVNDPQELEDLGQSQGHEAIRHELEHRIFDWLRRRHTRTTISHQSVDRMTDTAKERGFLFGVW